MIKVLTLEMAYICLKRPYNLSLSILEQSFMVMEEVDKGIRSANISPITQVVMKADMDLGLKRPSTITL